MSLQEVWEPCVTLPDVKLTVKYFTEMCGGTAVTSTSTKRSVHIMKHKQTRTALNSVQY